MICSLNFILFQCILQAAANPSADLSWLCSSLGGLTNDRAMSVHGKFEHKITSWSPQPRSWLVSSKTSALSTRLGSHVYFFGWLGMPPRVNEHRWMASQNKSSNSASHVRFGGGFRGSWTDHRYCLRQSTNRAVDTRRVILCSGSHRTLIAQSWVRPPARNRLSSDPQRSASLPKECTEILWNSWKINKTHQS